jgi:hypothetical protein
MVETMCFLEIIIFLKKWKKMLKNEKMTKISKPKKKKEKTLTWTQPTRTRGVSHCGLAMNIKKVS